MIGELAALTCAVLWAIAARLFKQLGQSFSPLLLNFWKGLVAAILLLIAVQFLPSPTISTPTLLLLLVSGVIGIGLGDTFFFQAINRIGDSQTLLVAETLAPILTALLAIAWLSEWLTTIQWLAIAIIIISVDMVIRYQRKQANSPFDITGVGYAGLAALCQALGAVISRQVLTTTELDALNASFIRLLGGMAIIVVLMLWRKKRWLPVSDTPVRVWGIFAIATFFGTFAGLYLQMLAFAYTKAAIVQTLFATSIVFSLALAVILGDKIKPKTVVWSMIALTGVMLLILNE